MQQENHQSTSWHSLLVEETFVNSTGEYSSYDVAKEDVGVHGIKASSKCCPSESWFEKHLTCVERRDRYMKYGRQRILVLPWNSIDAKRTVKFLGKLDNLLFMIFHDGRVSFNGCLDEFILDANLRLKGPECIDRALTSFQKRNGFDLRHWDLHRVEIAIQWWSSLSMDETIQYFGRFRGQSIPVQYKLGSGKSDSNTTGYFLCVQGENETRMDDPIKVYDVSKKYQEKHNRILASPESSMHFFRFERAFTSGLWLPVPSGSSPSLKDQNPHLTVGDLTRPDVYDYLVGRFVGTVFDIDKKRVPMRPIGEVKGKPSTVYSERIVAEMALEDLDETQRQFSSSVSRAYLLRLQKRHGDLLEPSSFWGRILKLLMNRTIQNAPFRWERLFGSWGYMDPEAQWKYAIPPLTTQS